MINAQIGGPRQRLSSGGTSRYFLWPSLATPPAAPCMSCGPPASVQLTVSPIVESCSRAIVRADKPACAAVAHDVRCAEEPRYGRLPRVPLAVRELARECFQLGRRFQGPEQVRQASKAVPSPPPPQQPHFRSPRDQPGKRRVSSNNCRDALDSLDSMDVLGAIRNAAPVDLMSARSGFSTELVVPGKQ